MHSNRFLTHCFDKNMVNQSFGVEASLTPSALIGYLCYYTLVPFHFTAWALGNNKDTCGSMFHNISHLEFCFHKALVYNAVEKTWWY